MIYSLRSSSGLRLCVKENYTVDNNVTNIFPGINLFCSSISSS